MRTLGIATATFGFGVAAVNLIMSNQIGYEHNLILHVGRWGAVGIVGVIIALKSKKFKH
jgi:hypothetical protein